MKKLFNTAFAAALLSTMVWSCDPVNDAAEEQEEIDQSVEQIAITATFGGRIDMDNLPDYEDQDVPAYITKDNTASNEITDAGATLGRVLIYDKNLSSDNTVSCASCHQQKFAFGDVLQASAGVNGSTGRHSMRLVNARFAEEDRFFWDERAATLEIQTTQPIQDHIEMGFSGENGDESIDDLVAKLQEIPYYQELFTYAFGSETVSEARMQNALAQFIRSIQSFDSRFDNGMASANNVNADFTNYSAEENNGKRLFLQRVEFNNNGVRIDGGLGCGGCHRAPEFDIDPDSRNNGVTLALDGVNTDNNVTRSPSLRDLFNNEGEENGLLMHTGDMTIEEVLDHYNDITDSNNTDRRLVPRGSNGQNLMMTEAEKSAVIAFIKTLSGTDIYTNDKWSDPFSN